MERITNHNPENSYTIARLSPEQQGEDRLVALVGSLAELTPVEAIIAQGWRQHDARYV